VRVPWLASLPTSQADSASALLRAPVSSSTSGGFHSTKSFSPLGEEPPATSTTSSRPVSFVASSPGLPTVALARHHRGEPP
jgi:hypothetical protein